MQSKNIQIAEKIALFVHLKSLKQSFFLFFLIKYYSYLHEKSQVCCAKEYLIEIKHIVYNQSFDKKIRLLKPDRNYRPLIWILDLSKMSQEIS